MHIAENQLFDKVNWKIPTKCVIINIGITVPKNDIT